MKTYVCMLVTVIGLVSIPTYTQDKGDIMTSDHVNCRYWHKIDDNGKLSFMLGVHDGIQIASLLATDTVQHAQQISRLAMPDKLSLGEVIGRLDSYCSDDKHQGDILIQAIKQMADDFNKR